MLVIFHERRPPRPHKKGTENTSTCAYKFHSSCFRCFSFIGSAGCILALLALALAYCSSMTKCCLGSYAGIIFRALSEIEFSPAGRMDARAGLVYMVCHLQLQNIVARIYSVTTGWAFTILPDGHLFMEVMRPSNQRGLPTWSEFVVDIQT